MSKFLLFLFFLSNFLISAETPKLGDQPAQSILFWDTEKKIEGFKNIRELLPTRIINKSDYPLSLSYELDDFFDISYRYKNKTYTIQDYINKYKVGGLIILRNGKILHEEYNFGNNQESRWISFSVTKSVTSMLLGAAIKDGFIKNVEEPVVTYLPHLIDSSYKDVTIKQVLHMSSGIKWNEDYTDPYSDVSLASGLNSLELYSYLNKLRKSSNPGEKFNYNTGETNLIGGIVRSAIGNNLSTYLEQKIWKPFGMEHDAYWVLDNNYSLELGGCCINATLRDYSRIGLFAMNKGITREGIAVLPNNWIDESTNPSNNLEYYGYQWWLDGPEYESFYADGIFGQFIWIDPSSKIVVAMQSVWDSAASQESMDHRRNFMIALIQKINK
jgi:CubicO group peptidase (beta-lactamase class C family)